MDLIDSLRDLLGADGVLTGADVTARADWRGVRCEARAVIRPRSTAELSAAMKLCHAARQPVVAAGGLTGLVRGGYASGEEVQVSFERMRAVGEVDAVGRTVTVEAGAPLEAVHAAVAPYGLTYGVDLGARGSCTIGGNIATNAGGNTVIRYGMTRDNVLGLEAVLADGTIVSSMNALLKNNAGYDLKQLFVGSEGTLALVTRAVLRLHPAPTSDATAIIALDSFAALTRFFGQVGARLGGTLRSFEVMWDDYYDLIAVRSGRHQPPLPPGHTYYVIVESAGTDPERDEALFAELLGEALEDGTIADAVIAASAAQRAAIWAIREDVEGQIKMLMPGVSFDVSLPIARMQEYVEGLRRALPEVCGAEALMAVYGHIGDNNLHLLVAPRPWSVEAKHAAEAMVYRPLTQFAGSVSAEHCIGLDKREWLPLSRSPEEIALMRTLKAALDPENLLNPGKVF